MEGRGDAMYDIIIVGGGPAGLSGAIYAGRYRMKTLVLDDGHSELVGAHKIENWPGTLSISGYELVSNMKKHAEAFGAEIKMESVMSIEKTENGFRVKTETGEYEGKTLLLATGTVRRKLGVPGEEEFKGKGVSYCAACDAAFFKDKVVAVVGGSDAAATEALLLAEYAKKVYILYRRQEIRAEPITKERVYANPKIEIIPNVNVVEIKGDQMVKSVLLDNGNELELDGVFIEIGGEPGSGLAAQIGVELDDRKSIVVNSLSETNIPGVFAAGDATNSPFKQAITASAQGVMAAFSAYRYISKG
ncbi:MAG: FAD-dependent oxidoreductase [Candidatus Diapherotrites archaeon]|nr:FAD-dependent oxidoreductase [Candidatus Diapherotrites archaeon]